jgi:hypothetical protein
MASFRLLRFCVGLSWLKVNGWLKVKGDKGEKLKAQGERLSLLIPCVYLPCFPETYDPFLHWTHRRPAC